MYYAIVRQCAHSVENLKTCLDKAECHALEKGFEVGVLLNSRLAPDMHNLIYQVQSACDYLKGAAAWLSGQAPPRHEDDEVTLTQLRARIDKTLAFVATVKEADFADAAARRVTLSWAPGKSMAGLDYLLQMSIPNIYFHVAMAYAILRHNGVAVGKMDYLGSLTLVPA